MIEGFRPLQARLNAVGQTHVVMQQLGLETVRGAKLTVARKTGTTARTIRLTRVTDDSARVEVGGAGVFLEVGTRPHIIRPRNGKTLRFPSKGTPVTLSGRVRSGSAAKRGAFAFARFVRHPGTKAQPFLIPAAKAAAAKLGINHVVETWNKAA